MLLGPPSCRSCPEGESGRSVVPVFEVNPPGTCRCGVWGTDSMLLSLSLPDRIRSNVDKALPSMFLNER